MGVFVIASYHPKPGKDYELLEVVRDHIPILRRQKLITDRPAHIMRSKSGSIIEVFEWKSEQAVADAHKNPEVLKLWDRFNACCEYGKLKDVAELNEMFPHFEPVEF
ncbi:MAG TPA: hypothetical protein VHN11_06225 [Xanthobacteraceae bacterium]|nr:hypothetical protein [Xanthobacteraceae bacterium]